jgi:UDP-2,3-diacylglucosamine hydrolase
MFTGNHDMWVGDYLTRECGIEIYTKPQVLTLAGKQLFVAHGDNMNIKGQPLLRAMNAMFRSRLLRWAASWFIHPDHFLRFGKWWSSKSRKSHSADKITPASLNFLVDYALEHYERHGDVDAYIFGHMHYPYELRDEMTIMFMSDWSGSVAHYVKLDDNKHLELKTFDIDETIS